MTVETVTPAAALEALASAPAAAAAQSLQKKNRIQVSNTKKPLFFCVNLAKRYRQQHSEVEQSALGMGKLYGKM